MSLTKADIINQLQRDILPLHGFRPPSRNRVNVGLEPLLTAFPYHTFPTGAIHECISSTAEETAATSGFVSGILHGLMQSEGVCVWITPQGMLFPPALAAFGVEAHRVIFVHTRNVQEQLWAMEEALKCDGLAAVVGEINQVDFTASRRLQLAVEQSRVTGFILRRQSGPCNTIASIARWHIRPLASEWTDGMPGPGFPRFEVQLLKIRNGKPGNWQLEWSPQGFRPVLPAAAPDVITPALRKIV